MHLRFANFLLIFSCFLVVCSASESRSSQVDLKEAATISGLIEEIGQTWKTVLSNAQRDPPLDRERYEKILKQFPKISKAIDELKSEMDNLSTSIKTFVQHQRSFDINEQDLFKESEEQDPDRAIELQITQILNNKKEIIKKLLIQPLKPITLIIVKIIYNSPAFIKFLIVVGICWVIPPSLFLQPLLALYGWGPRGAIKGSRAARMQRAYCGPTVSKDSWFSVLGSMGMGGNTVLMKVIQSFIGAVVTVIVLFILNAINSHDRLDL